MPSELKVSLWRGRESGRYQVLRCRCGRTRPCCHSHQSCYEHCPRALNSTASIAGLKRRTVQAYLKGEILGKG